MNNIPSPLPVLTRTNTLVASDGYLEFAEIKEEDETKGGADPDNITGNKTDLPITGNTIDSSTTEDSSGKAEENGATENGNVAKPAGKKKVPPLLSKLSSSSLGKPALSSTMSLDSSRLPEHNKKRVRLQSH